MPAPRSTDILHALRQHLDISIHSIRRFPTGLAHYVYEAASREGERFVVRMADPEHWNGIPGGVYWHARLSPLGVPLPRLLGCDLEAPYPYMILERLPGDDLGRVYPDMTPAQKRTLAGEIAEIQNRVGSLPHARWFGYLSSYETPGQAHPTWAAVLESGLRKAESMITRVGVFDPAVVDRVRQAAAPYEPALASVPPAPFLDDTTTKNVIVHQGRLSGIVDVDCVCFGDRLDVLALTHMALLSDGVESDYVDYWAEAWQLNAEQLRLMHLYTAMHCVYFMGEVGQRFNKDAPKPVDKGRVAHLQDVLEGLLGQV